jgi:hypothetical protein
MTPWVVGLGIPLAIVGCGNAERDIAPRSPADACPCEGATAGPSPADLADVPAQASAFVPPAPPPEPGVARSISLGFIGDSPIGVEPTPPHREPAWTRPFPCHWTDTCWAYPPPCLAPYVEYDPQ